ncbi:MAG: type IV pilus modification protein PilV [Sulfuricaulis sp.]|nr:type IV pilus modification protein PilV [Sulfuricaulis sp.]
MYTLTEIKSTRSYHGFSLVEVLVALLVLSIGLLGLAALQTTGLKFNQQSYQRTQATLQAYDMLDRIRANPLGKTAGKYSSVALGYRPPSPPSCVTGGTPGTCDSGQMADYDIDQWNLTTANLLSEGRGQVSINASSVCTITITWKENDISMQLDVQAQL